jgi:hypothetical protein
MGYSGDYDKTLLVIDPVDDAMVADSDSKVVLPNELCGANRSRLHA